jgi:uncharacterized protein (TIGR03086 family)
MEDLTPAANVLAALVGGITDDQLTARTPCPLYTLGDLLDHVDGLALAFTLAARKEPAEASAAGPRGKASRLGDDWRTRITTRLARLAEAWQDPGAWTGATSVGGVDLPGEMAGTSALDELVLHGWDVARGSGQPFHVDDASVAGARAFVDMFSQPGTEGMRGDAFAPVVTVPEGMPALDRLLGLSGRDPHWAP